MNSSSNVSQPNATHPNTNPVNNNGVTALAHADSLIDKFNTLKTNLSDKISNINTLISNIPSVNNNSVSNNSDETKTKIKEYFNELKNKKTEIDSAISDLEGQATVIDNFTNEKNVVLGELSTAAQKISEKRDALNGSTQNNINKNGVLEENMAAIQTKKGKVMSLNIRIKALLSSINTVTIDKIKKTLNSKFFKLRYDLRKKIVDFYNKLSGTNSELLNTKIAEYTNDLSNKEKISILTGINKMINKMLKYVDFCRGQILNTKLGNINIMNNQSSNENKNYNKTTNLSSTLSTLDAKLNGYKDKLKELKTQLQKNFEDELKVLTDKIIVATEVLKKCIDVYIESLNFSGVNNQKKITKHNLQYIQTNADTMKSSMDGMKTTLNTLVSNQTTKSSAKLAEIIANLDKVLGSNTQSSNGNASSNGTGNANSNASSNGTGNANSNANSNGNANSNASSNANSNANSNSSSVSTNASEWHNSASVNMNDFERGKTITWNPSGEKIMKGTVNTGNLIRGSQNNNNKPAKRIHLVNVKLEDEKKPGEYINQSPVNFNLEKYKKYNGVYKVK